METNIDLMKTPPSRSGELNRAMASHNLNDTSSRSHALLSIQIEQDIPEYNDQNQQMTRQGKLVFVDLAGSIFSSCSLNFAILSFCLHRK